MKLSEIFEERPERWGFRGDPYFWDHLKERAENMEIISPEDLEEWIKEEYLSLSGKPLTDGYMDFAVIKEFAHGGMSSGGVDNQWWMNEGIPLLKSRLILLARSDPDAGRPVMRIELKELSEDDLEQCFSLKVSDCQTPYIASNEESWKTAKENGKIARPFAIWHDGRMIGFAMFAFDGEYEAPDDRYWLWRFMIGEEYQGKGYGAVALQEIIRYFRDHGADNIRLSTKEANAKALALHRMAGFRETGEMNGEEIVLQLDL